uniref:Putative secreted protein n=1 Tax=Anopheles darlingi TaxID=43151 RepID=A0A2M4DBZ4_ANODA
MFAVLRDYSRFALTAFPCVGMLCSALCSALLCRPSSFALRPSGALETQNRTRVPEVLICQRSDGRTHTHAQHFGRSTRQDSFFCLLSTLLLPRQVYPE